MHAQSTIVFMMQSCSELGNNQCDSSDVAEAAHPCRYCVAIAAVRYNTVPDMDLLAWYVFRDGERILVMMNGNRKKNKRMPTFLASNMGLSHVSINCIMHLCTKQCRSFEKELL